MADLPVFTIVIVTVTSLDFMFSIPISDIRSPFTVFPSLLDHC